MKILKRITLTISFLLSAFMLLGCNEQNEVTEKMLIGTWQCESIIGQTSSFNADLDQFNDYEVDPGKIGKTMMMSYFKTGWRLFLQEDNQAPQEFKFKAKTRLEDSFQDSLSRTKLNNVVEYRYISENEHQVSLEGEVITYSRANNKIMSGSKYQSALSCIKTSNSISD